MRNRYTLLLLLLTMTISQAGIDIYLPSLPAMTHSLHTSARLVQFTLTFYLVPIGLTQLFYGPLSDRFGRRPLLLFGLLAFTVGGIGAATAHSINFLLAMRFLQGLGAGATNLLSKAIMRDCYSGKELTRTASYIGMAWAAGPAIAPMIGGYIQHYVGWRYSFVLMALISASIFILALFKFSETNHKLKGCLSIKHITRDYLSILRDRHFLSGIAIILCCFATFIVIVQLFPFIAEKHYGLSSVQYGWLIMLLSIGSFCGGFSNTRLLNHFKRSQIIMSAVLAYTCLGLLGLFIALAHTPVLWLLYIPLVLMRMNTSLIYTNTLATLFDPYPHMVGIVSASYGFIMYVGAGIISSFTAHLNHQSMLSMNATLALIGIVMTAIFFSIRTQWKQREHTCEQI